MRTPPCFLSLMSTFFSTRPFAGVAHRPLLRVLLYLIVFGSFFAFFFPSTHVPHLMKPPPPHAHDRPRPMHPPTFAPPPTRPHRHRINAQRPVTRPDDHQNGPGDVWAERADAVRGAFLQAYNSYVTYAAPRDELRPVSKAPVDSCVLYYIERGIWALLIFVGGRSRTASMAGPSRI